MITQLIRKWWLFVLRSLAVILSGLAALVWPIATLTALRLLFGAYALADGLLALDVSRVDRHDFYHGWTLRSRGLASIALGVFICLWSGVTPLALFALIAAWAITTRAFKAMAVYVAEGKLLSAMDNLVKHRVMRER
jgi:uncharacterized membrane protein HdeD (DUF308 family)